MAKDTEAHARRTRLAGAGPILSALLPKLPDDTHPEVRWTFDTIQRVAETDNQAAAFLYIVRRAKQDLHDQGYDQP